MKIAPTLHYVVARLRAESHSEARGSEQELRALLAVARAARHEIEPLRALNGQSLGGGHAESCRCRLCRALARLEKVSKERKP